MTCMDHQSVQAPPPGPWWHPTWSVGISPPGPWASPHLVPGHLPTWALGISPLWCFPPPSPWLSVSVFVFCHQPSLFSRSRPPPKKLSNPGKRNFHPLPSSGQPVKG